MNIPARKLKKSAVKNIVRFPAMKANGGKTILVESILEAKYCLHMEFDPSVKCYSPQPRKLQISDKEGENTYTPDFEVHYACGARRYVEVKPLEYAQSAEYQRLFSRVETSLHGSGADFHVVDEFEIYRQPLLSNYEKLYQYRKRPSLDMRNLYECAEYIGAPMPLSHLVGKLGERVHLREVYSWLALGYLRFDMSSEGLAMTTEVEFDVC